MPEFLASNLFESIVQRLDGNLIEEKELFRKAFEFCNGSDFELQNQKLDFLSFRFGNSSGSFPISIQSLFGLFSVIQKDDYHVRMLVVH